jgi:hypothetical protein
VQVCCLIYTSGFYLTQLNAVSYDKLLIGNNVAFDALTYYLLSLVIHLASSPHGKERCVLRTLHKSSRKVTDDYAVMDEYHSSDYTRTHVR